VTGFTPLVNQWISKSAILYWPRRTVKGQLPGGTILSQIRVATPHEALFFGPIYRRRFVTQQHDIENMLW
jgi:hypothetical protein